MKENNELSNRFSLLQTDVIAKTDLSIKRHVKNQFDK